jgi:hypothetical protein
MPILRSRDSRAKLALRYRTPSRFYTDAFSHSDGAWRPAAGWYNLGDVDNTQTDDPVMVVDGLLGPAPTQSYSGRALYFRETGKTNIEVTVRVKFSLDQPGAVVCVTPNGTIRGMAMYWNAVFSRFYLVSLGDEYNDRVIYDSQPFINLASDHDITLRVKDGSVTGFVNNQALLGPITLPAEVAASTKHGFYIGQGAAGAGLIESIRFQDLGQDLGSGIAAPTIVAGTPAEADTASQIDVPYPANVAAGNLLVMLVGFVGGGTVTTPTGWTSGGTGTSGLRGQVWYKVADGTETGNLTVVKTGGSAGDCAGVMVKATGYVSVGGFSGQIAAAGQGNSASTSLTAPSVNLSGVNMRGLWFGAIASNNAITGPNGWDLVVESGTTDQTVNIAIYQREWDTAPNAATGTVAGTITSASSFGAQMAFAAGKNFA